MSNQELPGELARLREYTTLKGYAGTVVYDPQTRTAVSKLLHVLAWEQERGAVPDGYVVRHLNRDKSDNSLDNLYIIDVATARLLDRMDADPPEARVSKPLQAQAMIAEMLADYDWHADADIRLAASARGIGLNSTSAAVKGMIASRLLEEKREGKHRRLSYRLLDPENPFSQAEQARRIILDRLATRRWVLQADLYKAVTSRKIPGTPFYDAIKGLLQDEEITRRVHVTTNEVFFRLKQAASLSTDQES